jgi:hypothetical protein
MRQNQEFYDPQTGYKAPKATIISIVPFPIREVKPGLFPSIFEIAPSEKGEPHCLIVGEHYHYVYIDKDRGNLKVMNPSYQVAKAVVTDFNIAQLEAGPACHPGLFWSIGEWTPELIVQDQSMMEKLRDIEEIQNTWFEKLVALADDDWEKTRQHFCISDTQRFAAKHLDPGNTRMRPWILNKPPEIKEIKTKVCGACGSDVPDMAVICRYCGFVLDQDRYAKMTFAAPGTFDLSKVNMTGKQ